MCIVLQLPSWQVKQNIGCNKRVKQSLLRRRPDQGLVLKLLQLKVPLMNQSNRMMEAPPKVKLSIFCFKFYT
jgi:hypothetical protein